VLFLTPRYRDIESIPRRISIKKTLLRLNYTLDLCQKASPEQTPGIRDARLEFWCNVTPRLKANFNLNFEYSEDDVDFTINPSYQQKPLEDIIDILIFHPLSLELDAIFQQEEEARALQVRDILDLDNEGCPICQERYNILDSPLDVDDERESPNILGGAPLSLFGNDGSRYDGLGAKTT
jgi:hypothetical protein